MISFALFLFYIFLLLTRPIELFDLPLQNLRPMLLMFALTLVASLLHAFFENKVAARRLHLALLFGLTIAIGLSVAANGWLGGFVKSIELFAPAAGLFVLASLNLTSARRIKLTCLVIAFGVLVTTLLGINAYHTGFLSDKLVFQQNDDGNPYDPVPEKLQQRLEIQKGELYAEERAPDEPAPEMPFIVPAQEKSGFFLWRMRGLGFLNDPNDLAQAIVMCLPLLWVLVKKGALFRNLFIVWLPSIAMVYGILLTNSRGAILGAASLLIFGFHRALGTFRTLLAMAGLGMVVLAGVVGGSRGFSSNEASAADRIDFWYDGIVMFRHSPIFGVGFGNFTDHTDLTAHNSFVLAFAELGILGFFFWCALLVVAFRLCGQTISQAGADSDYARLATLIRASLTGFLVCGWFLSRTYQATLFLMLGMAIACWYCWALSVKEAGGSVKKVEWFPQTLLLMAGSMILIYLFIQIGRLL